MTIDIKIKKILNFVKINKKNGGIKEKTLNLTNKNNKTIWDLKEDIDKDNE
jgi:hypothetical protein